MTEDNNGIFRLLMTRRFLPLFVAQFLGAANDNLFKNALIILIIYRLGGQTGILVTLAAGLFILPYFLFSATAGLLSDRHEKTGLMRWWKGAEIGISVLGGGALMAGNVAFMLAILFLLGVQAAFYSPLKYAVLPELLEPDELIRGNAWIEGGTFLAILLGTIGGGVLVLRENGPLIVAMTMVALAVAGFGASLFLPKAHHGNPQLVVRFNLIHETAGILSLVTRHRDLLLPVLGISWFWLVGATYLTQLPVLAKTILAVDEHAVTLMLTMFSVGIAVGSMLCGRLLKGQISARYVPIAALAMSIFGADLWWAATPVAPSSPLATLAEFLARPASWRVLADLMLLAISGGIYIVPLYAILQTHSDEGSRARVIAANNILNAAFMVASAVGSAGLLALGLGATHVLLVVAIVNLGAVGGLRRWSGA